MVQKGKHAAAQISTRKPIRPIERQKMRAWLKERLNDGDVKGLEWHSKPNDTFKISWRHAARQGWSTDRDANLFERWALHTGKHFAGDEPDPKRWKANFRCALNSLPDVEEVKSLSVRRGNNAYRIYKFLVEKKTKQRPSADREEETTISRPTRKMPARASRRKSYKDMDVDSEADLSDYAESISSGGESPAHLSSSSSDCESMADEHSRIDGHELPLPDFEKICAKDDYESLKPLLKEKVRGLSIEELKQLAYLAQQELPYQGEDETASTTSSSMTDQEIVDLILDSESSNGSPATPGQIVDGYLSNFILWDEPVVTDPYVSHEEEVVTSHSVILSETPGARAEQILDNQQMEYTSLAVL